MTETVKIIEGRKVAVYDVSDGQAILQQAVIDAEASANAAGAYNLSPAQSMQRVSQIMDVGFVGAHGDTELFPGAGGPPQDFDIVTVDGVKKLFLTVKVSGSTYTTTERVRIVEFDFLDDGAAIAPVAWSEELNAGHTQGFTAVVNGSNVVFYTTRRTFSNGNAGKGFSKITWRGALTDDTDVTNYQLFGDAGSGHRFETYQNTSPCVSTDADNKYLVMHVEISGKIGQANRVLIYDRAEVEAAIDPLTVDPIKEFVEHLLPYRDAHVLQGIACDGVTVHQLYGYLVPEHVKYITRTSLSGHLEDLRFASGILDSYGVAGVRGDAAKGVMIRAEPEGLTVRSGKTYMGYSSAFVNDTPIVTASVDGKTFTIGAALSGTGGSPFDIRQWTQTDLPPTHGVWDPATTYIAGSNWTERKKIILEIGDGTTGTGWFGNTTGWYGLHGAPLAVADASKDILCTDGQALNIGTHTQFGGTSGYARRLAAFVDGELRLYDNTYGSTDNAEFGRLKYEMTLSDGRIVLEADPVGGRINAFRSDAPSNAGQVQILARDGGDTVILTIRPTGKVTATNGFLVLPDTASMDDDTSLWIPEPEARGNWKFSVTMQQSFSNSGAWADVTVDLDSAPAATSRATGANTILAADGALNSGAAPTVASYTDAKLTVIAAVGGVYLVNRLGSTKTFGWTWGA